MSGRHARPYCDACDGSGVIAQEAQQGVPGSGSRFTCPDCRPLPVAIIEESS